ncbi:hypothetical protein [Tenacibaculum finnmarkense]|uniref:hypothetical protein n=1 Tax=Tenacibaculum finnmarkense TaxID=2781243 RepID=UPI00187BA5BA|nr:hypothetical protein [Tenacibaculum finnmarkense]MBE7689041.1 hypothetical protein [Tenacibaculum finnmarkense genomovar ulcerans]MCD8411100.1 hypothetical protein [Tenacibaculum finnmarkense genomovar ulcerans]MCG8831460.1 hypothetical protein [Tenacibaculum finnmarkense]
MKKICPHCNTEFISNHARRIYCKDSHRVAAYNKRQGFRVMTILPAEPLNLEIENKGLSGLDNIDNSLKESKNVFIKQYGASTLANATTELAKHFLISDENKPVTRKDLFELMKIIQNNQFETSIKLQKLIDSQKQLFKAINEKKKREDPRFAS